MSVLTADDADAEAAAAERMMLDGRTAEAAALWRAVLARRGESGVRHLRIRAHREFRRGNWAAAEALYTLLAEARPRYAFLRRRAVWCLRHAERFAAEHLTPAHRERVLGALREAFPRATDVKTRPGPGGLNSIRNFRHAVLDGQGNVLGVVFEKSFLGTEAKGFARAKLLFESHPSQALLAPRYYGTIEVGPFRAILQEQVAGDRPSAEEWPEVQRRIVMQLWQLPPSPAVRTALRHTRLRNMLERLHSPGVFVNTIGWWPASSAGEWVRIACGRSFVDFVGPHLPPKLLRELRRSRDAVERKLRRLPLFVLHADMHQGNAFLDRETDRIWTIDWDRWTVEPVGAGLPVDPFAGEVRLPEEALRSGRFAAASPRPDDVRLAAALWELRASYKAGQFTRLAPLAELIVRYATL